MSYRRNVSQEFGQFHIIRKLGEGGMGAVYLADDTKAKCRIALKVVGCEGSDSLKLYERLLREAQLVQSIHHPFICPVYDVGIVNRTFFLTMPFIEGTPLHQLVGKEQLREQRKVAELVYRLAQA